MSPASWNELEQLAASHTQDAINGPTNSQAPLRLFGRSGRLTNVRITLFRDQHAWCPYCHKVWLWLEEMRLPYRVEKVPLKCYGDKEDWFLRLVPNGTVPAVSLDGKIMTQSDKILAKLERTFSSLGGSSLSLSELLPERRLERLLFGAWCDWLCTRGLTDNEEEQHCSKFMLVLSQVETMLLRHPGPFFRDCFSAADVLFAPFLERMSASLFYFKGFTLRSPSERPALCAWFEALESRPAYRGTQADFHTHVHNLPAQMGGCYASGGAKQTHNAKVVDSAIWEELPHETSAEEPQGSRTEALFRVIKHRASLISGNPCGEAELVDNAIRCALTLLATQAKAQPPSGADKVLRHLRDRVSVPRDMSIWAARRLRDALEQTAAAAGNEEGPPVPTKDRFDQDPHRFCRNAAPSCYTSSTIQIPHKDVDDAEEGSEVPGTTDTEEGSEVPSTTDTLA